MTISASTAVTDVRRWNATSWWRSSWPPGLRSRPTGSPTGRSGRTCSGTAASRSSGGTCRRSRRVRAISPSACPNRTPAPTSPRSEPRGRGRTAAGPCSARNSGPARATVRTPSSRCSRTGPPDGRQRHVDLSQLLIELEQPGVTIRPIISMTGEHHFNEVVFDGVFVPDEQVVGTIGEGWAEVTSELAYERAARNGCCPPSCCWTPWSASSRRGRGRGRVIRGRVIRGRVIWARTRGRGRAGGLPAVGVPADVAGGGRGARRGRGARDRGGAGQGRRDAAGERDHRGRAGC